MDTLLSPKNTSLTIKQTLVPVRPLYSVSSVGPPFSYQGGPFDSDTDDLTIPHHRGSQSENMPLMVIWQPRITALDTYYKAVF